MTPAPVELEYAPCRNRGQTRIVGHYWQKIGALYHTLCAPPEPTSELDRRKPTATCEQCTRNLPKVQR